MPVGTLPVDRWVARVWAGYWHASKHDVIQGRLARWYQYDIIFQHWVLAALPRAWNCWVRTYLRSAVLRLQRWWRHCLGYSCHARGAPWCYDQACSRATDLDLIVLGAWKGP